MDSCEKTIILYSSDSNPQYRKDIINVIALPENGTYRFRYKAQYISNDLKKRVETPSLIQGADALVVFRTNSVGNGIDPFLVPIRHVVIDSVDDIDSTIYIFNFTAKGYPTFSEEFNKNCQEYKDNVEFSKKFFDGKEKLFATFDDFPLIEKAEGSSVKEKTKEEKAQEEKLQEKAWIRIIEALSKYSPFQSTFFYKTMTRLSPETKHLMMYENTQATIEVWHYNSDYNGVHSASVQIIYDSEVLVSSCGGTERIECRYDKNAFSFIPKDIRHKTDSQISLNFVTEKPATNADLQQEATIRIPVTIKREMNTRLIYSALAFVGGLFIGINEIIDAGASVVTSAAGNDAATGVGLGWKVLILLLGSAFLGGAGLIPKGD